MKSEPITFSISHLKKLKRSGWEGVRNYQARNFMRDEMKKDDLVFFYHSNCDIPAIVGLMRVYKESHPDPTQFEKESEYYDPLATKENPRWFMVGLEFVVEFKEAISLQQIKNQIDLQNLQLVKKGSRLSVHPVPDKEAKIILKMAGLN